MPMAEGKWITGLTAGTPLVDAARRGLGGGPGVGGEYFAFGPPCGGARSGVCSPAPSWHAASRSGFGNLPHLPARQAVPDGKTPVTEFEAGRGRCARLGRVHRRHGRPAKGAAGTGTGCV